MKRITATLEIHFIEGGECSLNLTTNGVPHTMIFAALNNFIRGFSRQIVHEVGEVIPEADQEAYLDSRIDLDRKILKDIIAKQPNTP